MTDTRISELSEREQEILRLIATGASNKEIAQQLVISLNTVKVHARNIFSKIGVASRTEAAMFAVRAGLVETAFVQETPEVEAEPKVDSLPIGAEAYSEEPASLSVESTALTKPLVSSRRRIILLSLAAVILIAVAGWGGFALENRMNAVATVPAEQLNLVRWNTLPALPTPREGLAVTVLGQQIYAIAGKDSSGVSAVLDMYDPAAGLWKTLASKPTAVTNVNAAVLGGKIFVPGGELSNGAVTDVLEIYDPRQDTWETGKPLPVPLSAYAMVSFEGRLYIFGGWDGSEYRNDTYVFDPESGDWAALSSMKTTRAYSGAGVVAGQIYVVGGINKSGPLNSVEVYHPSLEGISSPVWAEGSPLPIALSHMGVISIADILYTAGGESPDRPGSALLEYHSTQDLWQMTQMPVTGVWESLGMTALGSELYMIGGTLEGQIVSQGYSYQAIYTVLIPLSP